MRTIIVILLTTIILLLTGPSFNLLAQDKIATTLTPEAQTYLDKALDIIQANSVKRDIKWTEFRQQTIEKAANAKTPADTYPAIKDALRRLGDKHSSLFTLEDIKSLASGRATGERRDLGIWIKDLVVVAIYNHSSASNSPITLQDRLLAINGTPLNNDGDYYKIIAEAKQQKAKGVELTVKQGEKEPIKVQLEFADFDVNPPVQSRLVAGNIGLIALPAFSVTEPDPQKTQQVITLFGEQVQALIRELDQKDLHGWIVDLRLNHGGNMWPMLTAVGPILGAGEVGGFVSANGIEKWSYQDGKAMNNGAVNARVPQPYTVKKSDLPVAILIDEVTASSGEAVVIAFKNRNKTRFFGLPTRGIPTGNFPFRLSDGAILNLTTSLDADRTGKSYDTKIPPDVEIKSIWALYGTDNDPVIKAAMEWLKSQY